jgi:Mce-associated membrane protein
MGCWAARLVALVGVLVALGVVALAGFGGYLYWKRVDTSESTRTAAVLPGLAIEQIPLIFGYDYQNRGAQPERGRPLAHRGLRA